MHEKRSQLGPKGEKELLREISTLKSRLKAAERALDSIRKGEASALVVPAEDGKKIFTLQGEQEPYRVFVETMNEGAVMVASDGTIVYSNKGFADIVRAPLEKVAGSAFREFLQGSEWPVLQELQEYEEAPGYRRACMLRALDGTLVPVSLSARPMKTGTVRSLCIVATDMTERKNSEKRVLRSEQQLRLIFDQIPAAIWTTDKDLRILSASGAALAPANLRAEELIGKPAQEFFGNAKEGSPPLAAHLAAIKGQHRSYDYNLAGSIFSVSVQPLRDAEGLITGVIGIALDVTEIKRATASVAKLAAIVESTQDAIYGATMSGYITTWNRGAEQMFGYSAGEVAGQHLSIIAPDDQRNEPVEYLEKLKHGNVIRPFESVRRCKDGSMLDVSITLSAVKDTAGRVIGISAIAHDLSDRKQVETELRKLSGRLLKVQDETRRDMARELHDSVIQALAAAVINLSMLRDSTQLLPEARKTLEETLKITEDSVREIRTFSYLLHPPLLDVTGLQSALRWYVEGYSKRSRVQVDLDLPDGRDRLPKEVELTLFRIVQEALTNIHRHSGGTRASISMSRAGEKLQLSIADDGHGMDAETLKKVRREGAVLGVGIAGMKQRLRQLGGNLDISSNSKGTVVKVTLPLTRRAV